jgi:hypothetical protein
MQNLLDKMMRAGWVSATSFHDKTEGSSVGGIRWTGDGIARLQVIAGLITEIERAGGSITNEEMPYLKALAQLVAMQHPPPPIPPATAPPRF